MQTRPQLFRGWRLLLSAALPALVAAQACAIDLLVYNNNNNGPGSLRQAVTDNNGLGGGNRIVFSNIVTGTITLASELAVSTNATILGPGPDVLTLSGNNSSRIFNISGGSVAISGLTIANGWTGGDGGGVFALGTLNLSNCLFIANAADTFGGAVSSSVNLIADRCAFITNTAWYRGGALIVSGSSTVNNSTIVGNTASNPSEGTGGGIHSYGGLTVNACTIVGNAAASDGGGIYGLATTVRSTIIAGNSGNDVGGTFISGGYSLIGKTDGSTGWGAVGDQLGTIASPINPNLFPLGLYAGSTPTMPPQSGSMAIDQGKNFGATTDQRGRTRIYDNPGILNAALGDGTDIGAVEVGIGIEMLVTNSNDSGPGSLRHAILDASPIEKDTVAVAPNATNTIVLTSGEIVLNKNMTIAGPTTHALTVSGNNSSRVFLLTGASVSLQSLTIANGLAADGGGVRVDGGSHSISYCQIISNSTTTGVLASGGGVLVKSNATLNLYSSSVTHNQADFSGGGIAHNGSNSVFIVCCTIASNRLNYVPDGLFSPRGAGIALSFGALTVDNSTIASNTSTSQGGGVDNQSFYPGIVSIRNSIVAGNSAPNFGPDMAGAFISVGYNLIGNSSGGSGLGATGDQLNVNPLLGPVANYGGPTLTMALRSGSPAIDKGQGFGLPTDQRGFARQLDDPAIPNASGGDGADIGGYEADSNFRIVDLRRVGNDVALSMMSILGRNYRAEYTNDLASGTWTIFTNNAPGNGYLLWVTNSGGANQARRFYRGAIVP